MRAFTVMTLLLAIVAAIPAARLAGCFRAWGSPLGRALGQFFFILWLAFSWVAITDVLVLVGQPTWSAMRGLPVRAVLAAALWLLLVQMRRRPP